MSDQTIVVHPGSGTYFLREESFTIDASVVGAELWARFLEATSEGDIPGDLMDDLIAEAGFEDVPL